MYSPGRRSDTYRRHRAASQDALLAAARTPLAGSLPTDRISGGLVQRVLDLLCKVRFRGGWLYLLILLEFQSENDPFMALRILTYTCLTYEELIRRGEVRPGNKLPPLLPVAVYNGWPRWRAATDVAELIAPMTAPLAQYLPSFRYLLLDLQRIGEQGSDSRDLVTSPGIVERDPTPENLQRILGGLRDQVHRDGERALVQRLAARKFGAETAERLTRILEDRTDPDRLDEVVDAIIDCDSGPELFARVRA